MPRNRSEKETPGQARWRSYLVAAHVYCLDSSPANHEGQMTAWMVLTHAQRLEANTLASDGKLTATAKKAYDAQKQK